MNKTIAYSQLESLFQNHRSNTNLPFDSNSVVVDLLEIENFILQAKNTSNCDAVKIYFIRYPFSTNPGHISSSGNNLTQISLAFVPANFLENIDWTAKDIKDPNGNDIFSLLVCAPDSPRDENDKTSLCPPKGVCP